MWLFMYCGSEYYNSSYAYGQKLDCYLRLYGQDCLNSKCLVFKPYDRLHMDLSHHGCLGMPGIIKFKDYGNVTLCYIYKNILLNHKHIDYCGKDYCWHFVLNYLLS